MENRVQEGRCDEASITTDGRAVAGNFCDVPGCALPIWSPNPDMRARQLIFQSESLRHMPEIWERIWFLDLPDFETPYRVHGGVI